jgi:D-amino-acid dehydrogenase
MRIVVLGAGVIGITTAWYLLEHGHEVVVVDRQLGPARETSYANAGEISPGYASPWAGPGIPRKALGWLMMRHAPLVLRPRADPAMLAWLMAMLGNCTSAAYARNKERMVRLAEFSRDCLDELRASTGIAYDERTQGTLQLFRKQKQLDAIDGDLAVLRRFGVPFEILDRQGCILAEPGLANAEAPIAGGLRLPNDQTGDCFKFTEALAQRVSEKGGQLMLGTTIAALHQDGGRISGVATDRGMIAGDAYVVALGSYSPALVAPLGLRVPVYPVKGYSITVPIAAPDRAPVSTLLDESFKVAITRLGDRIRVAGMAEISGFSHDLLPRRRATLLHSLTGLFPAAADTSAPQFWSGLRPMTPDSTPVIGATGIANLFLNTGHGTLGWTMACGSGRVLAGIIEGNASPIATDDLGLARYSG